MVEEILAEKEGDETANGGRNGYQNHFTNSSIEVFNDFLERLKASIRQSELPVMVAGDFNFKSASWNSPIEAARRVFQADLMASLDMIACNQGGSPTFVRGNSGTFIDVTFVQLELADGVNG
ncbi:Endonuclease/exonuclease/phosphatase [Cinara cedri]|uniref:Endonuclease/exonuclease/phosphatase n=1 Tax=Cinara cedri TaxID=506608 RepID=A0A5E4MAW4_9HEMI|nr:Endonuclease/exonuclease/phosphatase [Cinara cedri]